MIHGLDFFGQTRGGGRVLGAIEHPERLDRELHPMAAAEVAHLPQRAPLLAAQTRDLGTGRGRGPAAVLDQHRGADCAAHLEQGADRGLIGIQMHGVHDARDQFGRGVPQEQRQHVRTGAR
jgi:hypothetical protein